MKSNSVDTFKRGIEKAFSDPSVKMNQQTSGDAFKLMSSFNEEELEGGKADKMSLNDIAKKHDIPLIKIAKAFIKGFNVELEHTKDQSQANEIAMDHLYEDPRYYSKLEKIETKEQLIVKPVSKKEMRKIIDKAENDWEKEPEKKVTAKSQFATDLQKDKDFEEFKKNAKYEKGGSEFTFGTPNVTKDDPYISKKTKYGRPGRGKEEATEATGSGSSGAFVGPIAFSKDFMKRSNAENPKSIKEEIGEGETTEATTTGSSGAYETPSMWAKSTKKKDWGPSRKTQYPGGSFVSVKKKCTRFPYCNQGDINALNISKNESVSEAIKSVANRLGIKESYIKAILEYEYEKMNKRSK